MCDVGTIVGMCCMPHRMNTQVLYFEIIICLQANREGWTMAVHIRMYMCCKWHNFIFTYTQSLSTHLTSSLDDDDVKLTLIMTEILYYLLLYNKHTLSM